MNLISTRDAVRDFSPRQTSAAIVARLRGEAGPSLGAETPEQAANRRAAERRSAGSEMARVEMEGAAELATLAATEARARRHLESLSPAYRLAVSALDDAQMAHLRRQHDLAYQRERIVRRIEAAADPEIDAVLTDLNDLFQLTLATPIDEDERGRRYDGARLTHVFQTWSNLPSIEARRSAILALRAELLEWKTGPDQQDIRERMASAIEALPDASTMVMIRDYPVAIESRPWPSAKDAREALLGWMKGPRADRSSRSVSTGLRQA